MMSITTQTWVRSEKILKSFFYLIYLSKATLATMPSRSLLKIREIKYSSPMNLLLVLLCRNLVVIFDLWNYLKGFTVIVAKGTVMCKYR